VPTSGSACSTRSTPTATSGPPAPRPAELARTADALPADGAARAGQLADACVLAQWRAAPWRAPAADAGRRAAVRRTVALLRAPGVPAEPVLVGAAPRACADLVEAMAAVAARAPDARGRVEALDALMLTGPALNDASAWATLAVSRLYARLGDEARALAVVRQRSHHKGWPRYLATALAEEARLARWTGDSAGAGAASRRYAAFRADPESSLAGDGTGVRGLLARPGSAPGR
jgi:hypothetical protein